MRELTKRCVQISTLFISELVSGWLEVCALIKDQMCFPLSLLKFNRLMHICLYSNHCDSDKNSSAHCFILLTFKSELLKFPYFTQLHTSSHLKLHEMSSCYLKLYKNKIRMWPHNNDFYRIIIWFVILNLMKIAAFSWGIPFQLSRWIKVQCLVDFQLDCL